MEKIGINGFEFNEISEDDIFLELNGTVGDVETNDLYSTHWACHVSGSMLVSITSASNPANTYTELGCC